MVHLIPSWVLLLIAIKACTATTPLVLIYTVAAILTTAWQFYGLWYTLFVHGRSGTEDQSCSIKTYSVVAFILVAALLSMALSFRTGYQHDYVAYAKQWDSVLKGADPWLDTGNAYGPIHNLLAWTYRVHGLFPKLIFSFILVATGAISSFFPTGVEDRTSPLQRCCFFAFFTLSPFSIITVNLYANNDILTSTAMVLSIIGVVVFNNFSSRILSGGILAVGVMSKFYPVIILPSLVLRRRCIDWKFLSGFLGTLILVASFAYKVWRESIFIPLLFAGARESKHLSIFSFTRIVLNLNLDGFSVPTMLFVFLFVVWFLFRKNIDPLLSSIITFAAVLSFYKVGHQQFFLFFFLVSPFAIRYLLSCSNILNAEVTAVFFMWIGFLNWYQLQYQLTCGMQDWPATLFRHFGSLPYLMISTLLAVTILRRITASGSSPTETPDSST